MDAGATTATVGHRSPGNKTERQGSGPGTRATTVPTAGAQGSGVPISGTADRVGAARGARVSSAADGPARVGIATSGVGESRVVTSAAAGAVTTGIGSVEASRVVTAGAVTTRVGSAEASRVGTAGDATTGAGIAVVTSKGETIGTTGVETSGAAATGGATSAVVVVGVTVPPSAGTGPPAIGTARARRREDLAGVPRGSVFRIRSSTRT